MRVPTVTGNSREEIQIALQLMGTLVEQHVNRVTAPKPALVAPGGGGAGTPSYANAALVAQGGVNQQNSLDYLTNSDKITLVAQWFQELATQCGFEVELVSGGYGTTPFGMLPYGMGNVYVGEASPVNPAPGSLDWQANQVGVSHAAYDGAIEALYNGLIAAGAPQNWDEIWPDGQTFKVAGIETALGGWWQNISQARIALQNAIVGVPVAGVSQQNSTLELTNSDQITIMGQWNAELALQTQLDGEAVKAGVSSGAYDTALSTYEANLITAGAPSNWTTTWPDGNTLTLLGGTTTTTIGNWWADVVSARKALENAIHLPVNGQTGAGGFVTLQGGSDTTGASTEFWALQVVLTQFGVTNSLPICFYNPTMVLNLATAGAGGLQSGYTLTANTVYDVYAIATSQGGNITAFAVPTGVTPTLPTGYNYKKLMSFVLTDASKNIVPFWQQGCAYAFDKPQLICSGTLGTWSYTTPTWQVEYVIPTFLPYNAATIKLGLQNMGGYMICAASGNIYGGPQSTTCPSWGVQAPTGSFVGGLQFYELVLVGTPIYVMSSGTNCYAWCYGCTLNL